MILSAVAYACTPQATISTNQSGVVAGQTVTGSGRGFSTAPTAGLVQLWWNSTSGSPLWSGNPDASGRISFSLPVPANVQPGYYTIVAGQGSFKARAPMQVPAQGGGVNTGPSPQGTITGDLWSGFTAGQKPSLASVVPDEGPQERPSSWALSAGAALLSLGLVSLFAGFLIVASRRRQSAEVTAPPHGGSGLAS
jgi:hypothetical protein